MLLLWLARWVGGQDVVGTIDKFGLERTGAIIAEKQRHLIPKPSERKRAGLTVHRQAKDKHILETLCSLKLDCVLFCAGVSPVPGLWRGAKIVAVNQKGVSGNVAIFEALNEIDDAGKFGEDLVLVRQSVRHAAYCSTVLCSTRPPVGWVLPTLCLFAFCLFASSW